MERSESSAYRDQNKSFLMKMREQALAKKAAAAGGDVGGSDKAVVGEGAAAAQNKAMFMNMRAAVKGPSAADEAKAKAAAEAKAAEEARERELLEREAAERRAFKEAEEKREREEKEQKEKEEKEQKEKEEQELKDREAQQPEPQEPEEPAEPEPEEPEEPEPQVQAQIEAKSSSDAHEPSKAQSTSTQPAASSVASGTKPVRCKAVTFYQAKKKGELSFSKGDIVFVPKFDQNAKALAGVCKGKSGWFPANCVINTENGKRCGPPTKAVAVRCKAVGNYVAKAEGELTLNQGDIVFVTMKTAGAMWTGVKQGKVGRFPRQFVIDEEEQKKIEEEKAAGKIKIVTCCAIKPYHGKDGELTFTYGDHVVVPKKTNSNMWQGVFKGNVGYFPASYVVDMAEYSKEQINQLIEVEKQLGDNQPDLSGGPGFDSFDGGPDPFAPQQNDPFAPPGQQAPLVVDDPWAPKQLGGAAAAPVDDPWAPKAFQSPQPGRGGGSQQGFGGLGGIDVSAYEAVAEPVASPKTEGWTCEACTFLNPDMHASQCEMCQAFRGGIPLEKVSPPQPDGQWNCIACTFLNRPETLACGMCAVERPTTDPVAVALQNEEIAAAQLGHLSMTQQPGQAPVSSQDEAKMRKAIAKAEKEEQKRLAKLQKEQEKLAKKEQKLMKKASKKNIKNDSSSA